MTKEMIIKRLEKLAESNNTCDLFHADAIASDWVKYGKDRTYLSVVEKDPDGITKHYIKNDCGYYDNIANKYVPGKVDLSEDVAYNIRGYAVNLVETVEETEEVVETVEVEAETTEVEEVVTKYNRSEIFKNAWKLVKETGISISEALKKAWAEAKANVEIEMSEEVRTKYNNAITAIKYAYELFVEKRVTAERAMAMLEQCKKLFVTIVDAKNVIAKFQFETEKYINVINA